MDGSNLLWIVVFVLAAGAVIAVKLHLDKKRREAYQALAAELGLQYSSQKDRELVKRTEFLNSIRAGGAFSSARNQYAVNILSGELQGHRIRSFEYHYETHSQDSKGRRQTTHYWFTICTLHLPRRFPELLISPEGLFSKLGQALGYDDIDFESYEFSKRYCVRSKDKKLAYDFCNARMIEYLLSQDRLTIEVEAMTLALTQRGRAGIDEIRAQLEHLLEIRARIPNYLLSEAN